MDIIVVGPFFSPRSFVLFMQAELKKAERKETPELKEDHGNVSKELENWRYRLVAGRTEGIQYPAVCALTPQAQYVQTSGANTQGGEAPMFAFIVKLQQQTRSELFKNINGTRSEAAVC